MKIERSKQCEQQSARDIESHHFDQGPSGEIDPGFFRANKDALNMAKELLSFKEAKLIIDQDSTNLSRAIVKNKKGEIIFSTSLPDEIEDLADIAYQ